MHLKFQKEYIDIITEKRKKGEIHNIKPAALSRRDYLLNEVSKKLKRKKKGDLALVIGSTVFSTAVPFSGIAIRVTYVTHRCRYFSKKMGIVASMKVAAEEAAHATGEEIYGALLDGVLNELTEGVFTEGVLDSIPGANAYLLLWKGYEHREYMKKMIDRIYEKAKEYHERWIDEQIKMLLI
jgi:hypothetical protein